MAQIPQNRQFQEAKVPSHWGTSERRYAQSVNDLFERLFYMFGRLSKDDLSKPLNKEITDATGNILRIETDVDNVTLTLSTVQGDVSSLTLTTQEFATRITNAEGDLSALEQTAQQFGVRLQNAEDDVTTLEATAQGLQTSVTNLGNTKNRTYINAIAPSVGLIAGDLWIDTANGNLLKRYNGSAWVAVQDGAISIAQQQADKIQWLVASGTSAANMTLTSQLYSLMASNIDLSANESIKLAVQVGGTNLIKNSKFAGSAVGWAASDAILSQNADFLRFTTNNPTGTSGIFSNTNYKPADIVVGETYTITIKARMTTGTPIYVSLNGKNNLAFSGFTWSPGPSQIQSRTFVADETTRANIIIFKWAEPNGGIVDLYWIKLERGNKGSDWSPHPEDPASGVKTSKVTIDGTGIAMTTGGAFTTTSQNFNIDAAGNVTMKGQVEAASGKIGGFTISGNKLVDTATGGTKAQFDPTTGTLILNDLEITQEDYFLTFRSRFVNKLRYFDFSNPNGSFVFRASHPDSPSYMTRFDIEMPTAGNPYGRTYNYGDSYIDGNCSAQSFTDRTPAYFGNALDELRWTSGSRSKGIDHSSLPKFAQKTIIGTRINEDGEKEDYQEEGRDLGAMVSVLTRAVQQLADKVDSQQRLIEDLNRRVSA